MKTPPVIILGMHRSGTTMVTQMLQKLGFFAGWILQENYEAVWFLERNERLLEVYGGSWENPEGISRLLQHSGMRALVVRRLNEEMRSTSFLQYTGLLRAPGFWNAGSRSRVWGWKDPRNCFTLPIWLDLFPNARIVHIVRHPLDVALSLQRRGNFDVERRLKKTAKSVKLSAAANNLSSGIRSEKGLIYLYRRMKQLRQLLAGSGQYEKFRIPATTALECGVRLWIRYSSQIQKCKTMHSLHWYECKYEDFVQSPEKHLRDLAEFCRLPVDEAVLKIHSASVRSERCLRYVERPDALELYEEYKSHPIVKQMGY